MGYGLMNTLFSITAILTIMQGGETVRYQTQDHHCDSLLRTLSEQMPDADMTCTAKSMRPMARPADLLRTRGVS